MNLAVDNIQNCLRAIHLWLSQNGLVINPEKSEAMLLSTAQRVRSSPLPLNKVKIAVCTVGLPLSDSIKILGVTIDRHLKFNTHVQNYRSTEYI